MRLCGGGDKLRLTLFGSATSAHLAALKSCYPAQAEAEHCGISTHRKSVKEPMDTRYDVVVIGGGQAGLAAGYHLQRAGLRFIIIDAACQIGGSWSQYYESLRLFSPARYAALPGFPFGGNPDSYPTRDEVVAYLQAYATYFNLPIVSNTSIQAVQRRDKHFWSATTAGTVYPSDSLIAATGSFRTPTIPQLPGQEHFRGQILHAADYRTPDPFRGKRVIVVGAGNSAVQIGSEVAEVARVTLAVRHPVRFAPQRVLGYDIHHWLDWTRLEYLPWLQDQSAPVLDTGVYQQALAANKPDQRPMFCGFTQDGVWWSGNEYERVDAIIFATGYSTRMPYLANLAALDSSGAPLHHKGISRVVPGLYYVGLSGQRSFRSATLRGVGADAAYVVAALQQRCAEHSDVSAKHTGRCCFASGR